MNHRYKHWTAATESFWSAIDWYLAHEKMTRYAASKKMNKHRTLLCTTRAHGAPLSPSNVNDFCAALSLSEGARKRLHTLAARGVGYDIDTKTPSV